MDEDDPQLALSRPISLAAQPPRADAPATPRLAVLPPAQQRDEEPSVKSDKAPSVTDLRKEADVPRVATTDPNYVNKLVHSVAALRSAVVGRRRSEALNERSFR